MPEYGYARLSTTVFASGTEIDSTGASGLRDLTSSGPELPTAANLSQLHFTSLESSRRPLVGGRASHFMPWRSLSVTFVPSGEYSHDSAASPTIASGPGREVVLIPALTRLLYTGMSC